MIKKRISHYLISGVLSASLLGCSSSTQDNTPPVWWGVTAGAIAGTLIGTGIKAAGVPFTLIGAGLGAVVTKPLQKSSARVSIGKISKLKGAQVIEVGDYVKVVIQSDQIFGVLNDRMRHDPDLYLNYVADLLNDYPKSNVLITVYSDNIGSASSAKELTQKQAQKVLAYLWDRGVNWRRMRAIGCGQVNDVATNRTIKGSAANRRIEITLIKPEPVPIFSRSPIINPDEPKIYK